jgi:3-hydroxyisobutyrate dehydrogenase-like beta-hydroxyacid dehydrogenase
MPSSPQKNKVGLLGLGLIGSRVARNLSEQGNQVWVWNRTPKPFPCYQGSPGEVAAQVEVIQIFLKDGPALLSVMEALAPSLTARHLILQHCTALPDEVKQAAAIAERSGSVFLDAPFTGSRDEAETNRLAYYLGGTPEAMERARPHLEKTARCLIPVGGVGQASLVKIATNMITASQVAALAEALALVESDALPAKILQQALSENASFSRTLDKKLECMAAADYTPRFSLENMTKDQRLAHRLLRDRGLGRNQVEAFLQRAEMALQIGCKAEDFSAIYRTLKSEEL